jgi:hypothetical protein
MPAPTHRVADEISALSGLYGQPVIINETLRIKSMFGAPHAWPRLFPSSSDPMVKS